MATHSFDWRGGERRAGRSRERRATAKGTHQAVASLAYHPERALAAAHRRQETVSEYEAAGKRTRDGRQVELQPLAIARVHLCSLLVASHAGQGGLRRARHFAVTAARLEGGARAGGSSEGETAVRAGWYNVWRRLREGKRGGTPTVRRNLTFDLENSRRRACGGGRGGRPAFDLPLAPRPADACATNSRAVRPTGTERNMPAAGLSRARAFDVRTLSSLPFHLPPRPLTLALTRGCASALRCFWQRHAGRRARALWSRPPPFRPAPRTRPRAEPLSCSPAASRW